MFNLATDNLAMKPYIPQKKYFNEFVANNLRDKDWPAKKVTIFISIFVYRKLKENVLFFCLHFNLLFGS